MRIINHKTTVALLLVAVLIAPAFAATVRQIGWEDLKVKVEFEDPFRLDPGPAVQPEHLRAGDVLEGSEPGEGHRCHA